MKKLLLIPIAALIAWGGVALYNHLRPPTPSEIIRSAHESIQKHPDLPIVITRTPPDVVVTWPQDDATPAPAPKAAKRPVPKPKARPAIPVVPEEYETPPPVVRCLFWFIGEAGCRPT